MFKRVEKRRRRKEKEDELGLDEEMKEVLGMHDSDSDESESDQSSSEDGDGDDDLSQVGEGVSEGSLDEQSMDEEEEAEEEDPAVTVREALKDPIYLISFQPEVKACIVCPGKNLKGMKMTDLHRASNAHKRRFKQFIGLAKDAQPNESAWDVLKDHMNQEKKPLVAQKETSRRAEKRKASQAIRKSRREAAKAKKAKKKLEIEGSGVNATTTSPSQVPTNPTSPRKKRKLENIAVEPKTTILPSQLEPPPTPDKSPIEKLPKSDEDTTSTKSILNIVKSASSRAKQARSRMSGLSSKVIKNSSSRMKVRKVRT